MLDHQPVHQKGTQVRKAALDDVSVEPAQITLVTTLGDGRR
ncbi:hypothetical protein [Brevundimonas sp.]|jgi:hypothetical protein